ncbi:MAG: hypothetical protein J7K40_05160 [candidate division Zixibacteria bacterium]|nr:hypothetical protein [candidate division Zixibacteria bacterium]
MKREVPLMIAGIVGAVLVIQYFIPHKPFGTLNEVFADWFSVIEAAAILLGVLNLIKVSGDKVYKHQKDWQFAIVIIITFIVTIIVGLYSGRGFLEEGSDFRFIYDSIYTPLTAMMFALLAFYVGSASYRAFRARNKEATILLLAAFFVMLGQVPLGDYLTGWLPNFLHMSSISEWIMNILNMAGQRAIMIGIALGIASTSLRLILGIERSYLGGD